LTAAAWRSSTGTSVETTWKVFFAMREGGWLSESGPSGCAGARALCFPLLLLSPHLQQRKRVARLLRRLLQGGLGLLDDRLDFVFVGVEVCVRETV
jgi:hypothetical protein